MVRLPNGVQFPAIGFGTWQIADGPEAEKAVIDAVAAGYRLFDTAVVYRNEASVGRALRICGVDRSELFVTTKVWNDCRGYDTTLRAFDASMERLGLSYLDLYLIHWPASASRFPDWEQINLDTWRALTRLYREKRVRVIGVSNFLPHHLRALLDTEVPPMVNQLEIHPGYAQRETVEFCRTHGVIPEAWSPLGRGKVLAHPVLQSIATAHGKTPAQVSLRWSLQSGVLPLPRTVNPARMRENLDVFDFALSPEEMAAVDGIEPFEWSGKHPDTFPY